MLQSIMIMSYVSIFIYKGLFNFHCRSSVILLFLILTVNTFDKVYAIVTVSFKMASSSKDSGIGRGSASEESGDVTRDSGRNEDTKTSRKLTSEESSDVTQDPGRNEEPSRNMSPEEREAKEWEEFNEGPLKLLTESVKNQNKVLISLRNNKKLIGRVKAFDRYFNMLLTDVKEMWTEVGKDGKVKNKDVFKGKLFLRGDNIILVLRKRFITTNSRSK